MITASDDGESVTLVLDPKRACSVRLASGAASRTHDAMMSVWRSVLSFAAYERVFPGRSAAENFRHVGPLFETGRREQ